MNLKALWKNLWFDRHEGFKIEILRRPLFWIVLAIKIAAGTLFASEYFYRLFAPFVNYFVISGFQNPYEKFLQLGVLNVFPYPAVMLWLLALPRAIFAPLLSGDFWSVSHLDLLALRLPVLLADLLIFLVLIRWLKRHQKKVLYYYWCSPVLFYISYLHGQLDAIPIAFLFISLYFLFKDKFYRSLLVLGLALAAKTGMLLAYPFILIYLWRKKMKFFRLALLAAAPLAVFVALNIWYLLSPGFVEIVLKTKEQFKIFDFNYRFSETFTFYFVPFIFLFILFRTLTYKYFNRDLFLMLLGFGFGVLILFIPPMPGWYFWILPFFIYFYIKREDAPRLAFILLSLLYFAYFLVVRDSDYLRIFQPFLPALAATPNLYQLMQSAGINADLVVNVVFTLLQGTLLLNIIWIYRKGIESIAWHKVAYQPYLLGVAGDSGAGKSMISKWLLDVFGHQNALLMEGDDMHRWERGDENWRKFTHLDPMANSLHQEIRNILSLKQGREISRRIYDHNVGKFTEPKKLTARKINILQGLHALYLGSAKKLLDLKIFIKPDGDLRLHWKIVRDIKDRGYSKEKVIEQLRLREGDSERFISVQEKHADLLISFRPKEPIPEVGNVDYQPDIYLQLKFSNDLDAERLLQELEEAGLPQPKHYFDGDSQVIEFYDVATEVILDRAAYRLMPEMWEIMQNDPDWDGSYGGLIQLFVAYMIFNHQNLN